MRPGIRYSLAVLPIVLTMACQPYLADNNPEIAAQPIAWQCPTPSPIPTVLLGYRATPTPIGPAMPIYSTAMPTATPYIRTGSDYYLGQRIRVGPLIVSITSYQTDPGPDADHVLHRVMVTVENTQATPVEFYLDPLSFIRTIRRPDGRVIEGSWYPAQPGVEHAQPSDVPGVWQPGRTTAALVIPGPKGRAESWGMPLIGDSQRRSGSSGDGYLWIQLRPDPKCSLQAGGPPSDAFNALAPAGVPSFGRGSWPVPIDTPISRGYGCDRFFTGIRGQCPTGWWWHDGIDFANRPGTPLFAVKSMNILYSGADPSPLDCSWIPGSSAPQQGFGLYIKAQDANGYTYWYGHISGFTVSSGQQVVARQQVGMMGSTGCSTNTHLHFRVRYRGLDRNPFDVIAKEAQP